MSSDLYQTIEAIGREKGIDTDVIIRAVEEAYAAASRKYYRSREDYGARFDRKSGRFIVFSKRTVVENEDEIMDPQTEVSLDEARREHPDIQIGEVIETEIEGAEAPLTRIAAQAAKQVIYQKVKEAERELIWEEYHERVGEILTGQVKRFDRGDMLVDLGRTEGIVPRREQSRAEHYNPGDRVRAVLLEVDRVGKGPQLILSRASETLVKKLFEMEVPEIYDGTVSIVSVARDAGERSKVAVTSRDRDVDPVGACVGMKGSRVQAVIREMRGEKIDIVQYDDDSTQYVRNALNPAATNRVVVLDYETREMEVIVGEDQLSLAIGKRGQNVRLASKLTGWSLDIKSELEKKAEVEAEIERLERASQELSYLPGVTEEIISALLEAGFRALEEVALASLEDLTSIEEIDEDLAIDMHDAAEQILEQWQREEEERAARAAEEGEPEDEEGIEEPDDDIPEAALAEDSETSEPSTTDAATESSDVEAASDGASAEATEEADSTTIPASDEQDPQAQKTTVDARDE